jgi:hypothetical protein
LAFYGTRRKKQAGLPDRVRYQARAPAERKTDAAERPQAFEHVGADDFAQRLSGVLFSSCSALMHGSAARKWVELRFARR